MCKVTPGWKIASRSFKIYKHTRGRLSSTPFWFRANLPGYKNTGRTLTYTKGTNVYSPSGPGIMGYLKNPSTHKDLSLIVLRVDKGIRYHVGEFRDRKIVCAEKVYVLT